MDFLIFHSQVNAGFLLPAVRSLSLGHSAHASSPVYTLWFAAVKTSAFHFFIFSEVTSENTETVRHESGFSSFSYRQFVRTAVRDATYHTHETTDHRRDLYPRRNDRPRPGNHRMESGWVKAFLCAARRKR